MFENARAFSTRPEATFTMAPMRIVRLTSCRPTIALCDVRHNRESCAWSERWWMNSGWKDSTAVHLVSRNTRYASATVG